MHLGVTLIVATASAIEERLPVLQIGSTGRITLRDLVEEGTQSLRARGVTQFAQRFCLDLTDAFACDIELFADLFKGVVSVHIDAKAHT